jgi:hypothetical protein
MNPRPTPDFAQGLPAFCLAPCASRKKNISSAPCFQRGSDSRRRRTSISSLPRRFFGFIDPHNVAPRHNVLVIGALCAILCAIGAFVISYQFGAELLNLGAFIGFMGVNIALSSTTTCAGRRGS